MKKTLSLVLFITVGLTHTVVNALPLNDTGITLCSNATEATASCPQSEDPNQDAQYGRDVDENNGLDGHAGFSFTKLDALGHDLPSDALTWSCVLDNVTGLIWEVKTIEGGLRDKNWKYSWYNSTGIHDGGLAGTENGGTCSDGYHCDTEKFAQQVNTEELCGYTDWRLPDRTELLTLAHFGRFNPIIDKNFFPNTKSSFYWTASPYAKFSNYAWGIDFVYGDSYNYFKYASKSVRLVHAQ